MNNWKAGDKALRIENGSPHLDSGWHHPNGVPVVGNVYLVAHVQESMYGDSGLTLALAIAGYPSLWNGVEWGYKAHRFRKIITATEHSEIEKKKSKNLTFSDAIKQRLLVPIEPRQIKLT